MNAEEFNDILDRRLAQVERTLVVKGTEYSTEEDRLHNFKRAAEVLAESPARACLGFMTKHLVSIMDMVDSLSVNQSTIDEKFTDAINYLLLLEAILTEYVLEEEPRTMNQKFKEKKNETRKKKK